MLIKDLLIKIEFFCFVNNTQLVVSCVDLLLSLLPHLLALSLIHI